jgi:hypothetical protein
MCNRNTAWVKVERRESLWNDIKPIVCSILSRVMRQMFISVTLGALAFATAIYLDMSLGFL